LLFEKEAHSVGLFYQLRDVALEVKSRARKLLSFEEEDDMNVSAWSFAVSQMKMLPCAADFELFMTDPDLIEEEEELFRQSSLGETEDKQNDAILHELKMGLKRGDKEMESLNEKMDAIQNHEEEMDAMQNHELEMMKEMKGLLTDAIGYKHDDEKIQIMLDEVQIIKKRENEEMDAMQNHELERMKEMKGLLADAIGYKHDDEKMQIMLEEVQTLRIQLTVVTLICVAVSVAAFLKLKQ